VGIASKPAAQINFILRFILRLPLSRLNPPLESV
jgi:hypothetical protein